MKKLFALTSVLGLLTAVFFGCASGGPHGTAGANYNQDGTASGSVGLDVTTNVNVGVTGNYNVNSGDWSAGFLITFKEAVPPDVTASLAAAGGQPVRDTAAIAWQFPGVTDPAAPSLMKAVTAAAGSGSSFTITPLK